MDESRLFQGFDGREAHLARIPRFSIYSAMYWRSNLLSHVRHVAWGVRELSGYAREAFPGYDPTRAEVLALVHDDAEMVTGDIQAGNKTKMSPAEHRALGEWERLAIERLSSRYPKEVAGYRYRDLLEDSHEPGTPEARVVKLVDKFDALGEVLHEIFGGNALFLTPVRNQYGRIPTPLEFYSRYFDDLPGREPTLAPLLKVDHPIFRGLPPLDAHAVARAGGDHTPETFRRPTGYEPYDAWREIILKHDETGKELRCLTTRRESYRVEQK